MIWLMFLLGQLLHLAAQADAIVRAENNPATSRLAIIMDRWIPITVRAFIGTMFFWLFLGGGLPDILLAFGVQAPQWLATLSGFMGKAGSAAIPVAGLAGFGIDSLIAYIPGLKSYVPPPIDEMQAAAVRGGFRAGVEATEAAAKAAVGTAAETVKETGPEKP